LIGRLIEQKRGSSFFMAGHTGLPFAPALERRTKPLKHKDREEKTAVCAGSSETGERRTESSQPTP
jgi:hypothetical protein